MKKFVTWGARDELRLTDLPLRGSGSGSDEQICYIRGRRGVQMNRFATEEVGEELT